MEKNYSTNRLRIYLALGLASLISGCTVKFTKEDLEKSDKILEQYEQRFEQRKIDRELKVGVYLI